MAKAVADAELCNGCGACARVCLGKALEIKKGKCAVVNGDICCGRGHCISICPRGALSVIRS